MPSWMPGAVGYEVYVRSFADSDGDGFGDVPGVTQRLPYLAELGVDIVWLTPFYESPGADHGYDVSDPRAVDERFGTLDDVRTLCDTAHALGLRVLVDIVPNHVSDQHAWFRGALAGDAALRDRFVVVDGALEDGPPNNWLSHFGGPAWTHRPELGGWYMHLFLPEQPDLNWENQAVRDEYLDVVRFWLEVGVDGLRIDVTHSLLEDPQLRDNPWIAEVAHDAAPGVRFGAMAHVHDLDLDATAALFAPWRELAEANDAVLIGETYLLDPVRVARYVEDGLLHAAFWFPTLHTGWDHAAIAEALRLGVEVGRGRFGWPISSHDDPHAAERFGGGELGRRRALAFMTVVLGLPGVPFLMQGDELGLDNGVVDALEDPVALASGGAESRDGSRTPMPWAPGPNLGFTTGTPWLPLGSNRTDADTVQVQADDPTSALHTTRRLLAARRARPDLTGEAELVWLSSTEPLLAYRRGDTVVACTIGAAATLQLGSGSFAHASAPGATLEDGTLTLPADVAVIVDLRSQ